MRRGVGCGGILVKDNTEEMKQAIWTREGQRGSLSLSLSTTRDGVMRREDLLFLASALRREGRQIVRGREREGDKTCRGRETFINEKQG